MSTSIYRAESSSGGVGQPQLNSIDLLDECLTSIYKCRKECIQQRIASRRNKKTSKTNDKQKSTPYQRNVAVSQISSQKSEEVLSRPSSSSFDKISNTSSDSLTASIPVQTSAHQQMMQTESHISASYDLTAVTAINNLKQEMHSWCNKNSKKASDEDERGDFADFLTEKYLCQV